MIPAGTLKYSLTFKELQTVQSDSGFITKTKVELFKCKAAKVKSTGNYIENAKELFHTNRLVFKIRHNRLLTDKLIVVYEDNEYNIVFMESNKFDNSTEITLERINE